MLFNFFAFSFYQGYRVFFSPGEPDGREHIEPEQEKRRHQGDNHTHHRGNQAGDFRERVIHLLPYLLSYFVFLFRGCPGHHFQGFPDPQLHLEVLNTLIIGYSEGYKPCNDGEEEEYEKDDGQ